jgi:hypothetical protein
MHHEKIMTVYVIQPVGFEYHEPDIGMKGWV